VQKYISLFGPFFTLPKENLPKLPNLPNLIHVFLGNEIGLAREIWTGTMAGWRGVAKSA
jgi:hypothetical protein